MFRISAHSRRQIARGVVALMLGLWTMIAVAPCTMAATARHDTSAPCMHRDSPTSPSTNDSNCEALQAADCQTRNADWLAGSTATPDFEILPPQAFLYPQAEFVPLRNTLPQAEQFALRLSPPPLYLQHGAFLI